MKMKMRVFSCLLVCCMMPLSEALAGDVAEGKLIFDKVCAYCHAIDGKGAIGPSLIGISERRDAAWLHLWLKNPREMIKKDADAKVVRGKSKYNMTMPALPDMRDDQKRANVIAYLLSTF
jgi:cytochrome c2